VKRGGTGAHTARRWLTALTLLLGGASLATEDPLSWSGSEPHIAVLRRLCAHEPAGPDCDALRVRTEAVVSDPVWRDWEARCAAREPAACTRLAQRDAWLTPGAPSPTRTAACELGDAAACVADGGPKALTAARALGHPGGDAGLALREAAVSPEQIAALHARLAAACDAGYAPACTGAGQVAEDGDLRVQPELWYQRGCDGQHAEGCAALGRLYQLGIGVRTDGARAAAALQQACRLGAGCAALGALWMEGDEVDQDVPGAVVALRRGCALGEAAACMSLARLYAEGYGGLHDPAAAAQWRARACALGDSAACKAR
jgi:TPR repeat protein